MGSVLKSGSSLSQPLEQTCLGLLPAGEVCFHVAFPLDREKPGLPGHTHLVFSSWFQK